MLIFVSDILSPFGGFGRVGVHSNPVSPECNLPLIVCQPDASADAQGAFRVEPGESTGFPQRCTTLSSGKLPGDHHLRAGQATTFLLGSRQVQPSLFRWRTSGSTVHDSRNLEETMADSQQVPTENSDSQAASVDDREIESQMKAAAMPFIGRWNRLVSSTNWQKGRIILQWRQTLSDADVPPERYSDEAWGRTVGGVTGQHVGRLRRVYQRFNSTHERFDGLFWSHFHASIEWDDAEMWLEGALSNGWSVAKMRNQRWETLGQIAAEKPQDADVVHNELDEDFETSNHVAPQAEREVPDGPRYDDPDFGDGGDTTGGIETIVSDQVNAMPTVRPFEDLPKLPDDMIDAFEAMKLAILRHKSREWDEVSQEDVLVSLNALKDLALAPSAD